MKIQLLSDLHLEFSHNKFPQISSEADVVIFAGDTATSPAQFRTYFQQVSRLVSAKILIILGNHEYYGHTLGEAVKDYKNAVEDLEDVYLLDNETLEVDGIKFVGTTMWTDFDKSRCLVEAMQKMSDYVHIYKPLSEGYKASIIDPFDILNEFEKNLEFLEEEVDENSVVITHHGPTFYNISERFKTGSRASLNGAYYAELSGLILDRKPKIWCYGHTHVSNEFKLGDTKISCNPYGYPHEGYQGYKQNSLLEV